MTIILYELAAANRSLRFSPHCWKSRLALVHKQLEFETEAVWFTEKEKIASSNQGLVPVLTDGENIINDSLKIAFYLEDRYPQKPALFHGDNARQEAQAFNQWLDSEVAQYVRPSVIMPIYNIISEQDKEYFRTSREEKLGATLEKVAESAQEKLKLLPEVLGKVREQLQQQPFIAGDQPDYRDICLCGILLWMSTITEVKFLEKTDAVYLWYQRMLERYDSAIPEIVKQKAAA